MSRFKNRRTFIIVAVLTLILITIVYGVRAVQDWFENDFGFPGQDCLMSTRTIEGTVKDEQNNPVNNANIEIKGHHSSCENAVRFPVGKTDTTGTFVVEKQIYSPILENYGGPTREPTQLAQMLKINGAYEVTISADGYIPYHKADMTYDEIFGGLNVVLKKR